MATTNFESYSIDFETKEVYYDGVRTNPLMRVKILGDTVYWGNYSVEEQCGIKPAPPGSWNYFGGSQERAQAAYESYVSWLLEKAIGLEEV